MLSSWDTDVLLSLQPQPAAPLPGKGQRCCSLPVDASCLAAT
jgi:hypothetical protein